jgi:hypothetical protein
MAGQLEDAPDVRRAPIDRQHRPRRGALAGPLQQRRDASTIHELELGHVDHDVPPAGRAVALEDLGQQRRRQHVELAPQADAQDAAGAFGLDAEVARRGRHRTHGRPLRRLLR